MCRSHIALKRLEDLKIETQMGNECHAVVQSLSPMLHIHEEEDVEETHTR